MFIDQDQEEGVVFFLKAINDNFTRDLRGLEAAALLNTDRRTKKANTILGVATDTQHTNLLVHFLSDERHTCGSCCNRTENVYNK